MEQATDKSHTILERGQIAHEDPRTTNPEFPSQESGTSYMSPKVHILNSQHWDKLQTIAIRFWKGGR